MKKRRVDDSEGPHVHTREDRLRHQQVRGSNRRIVNDAGHLCEVYVFLFRYEVTAVRMKYSVGGAGVCGTRTSLTVAIEKFLEEHNI